MIKARLPDDSPSLPSLDNAAALETLMNGPWATLVIRELLGGPLRFGEIKDRLTGISA